MTEIIISIELFLIALTNLLLSLYHYKIAKERDELIKETLNGINND